MPFTNAVMRRLAGGIGPLLAALPDGPLKESYPDWISEMFVRVLGTDGALALMRAMNEPLETVVRVISGEPPGDATDIPGAFRVGRVDNLAVSNGRIWPQSRGSQLAALCVGSKDGERVLDLCAAPGGKTGALRGDVTAVEIDSHRASELRANLATMGRSDVTVIEADGTALPSELSGFDRALVDAPCSGLGVLSQRPDLRWRATALPELQVALLRAAAERVKPGGTVLYSVCTLNPDECEARRRRQRPARPPARRRVAAVRAPVAAGVPPHAPARARDERLLHRAPHAKLTRPKSAHVRCLTPDVARRTCPSPASRMVDRTQVLWGHARCLTPDVARAVDSRRA